MRTHYDNLHVSEKASPEVIRGAYKALAQKWHPDKHPDQREKAERYFKIITRAFDILSDSKLRSEYDAWLVAQRSADSVQPKPEPAKKPPKQSQQQKNMAEAWEDGKRSREQGLNEKDCPYHDNDLTGAWQQGFKARGPASNFSPSGIHPWRRFFARLIDNLLITTISGLAVGFLFSFAFGVYIYNILGNSIISWSLFGVASMVVVETFLVSSISTTPGKFIFGITIVRKSGGSPSIFESLKRALLVNFFGQGAGIPGAGIITYPISYALLKKNGVTPWDKEVGAEVICKPLAPWRWALCVVITITAIIAASMLWKISENFDRQATVQNTDSPAAATQQQTHQARKPGLFDDLDPQKNQTAAPQPPALTADEIHFQKIYTAHPDADSVIATQRFKQWVGWSVARGKIYENGTADEVIKLLSDYKQHTVDFTEEIDSYLEHAYRMYPGLNFEGENPNQPAIEDVVNIRDQYINSGKSTLDALQMAVNSVAIKNRWKYPADSLKQ